MAFLLRMPQALHRSLAERAAAAGISLNQYCIRQLGASDAVSNVADLGTMVERARTVVRGDLLGLVVHGSRARGDAATSSDLDVLIVVDDALPLSRALYRQWDAGGDVGGLVDAHFAHLPRRPDRAGSVWCEAAIEGLVVADPTGAIQRTLVNVRRAIADGKLLRRHAHGQPYWTAA